MTGREFVVRMILDSEFVINIMIPDSEFVINMIPDSEFVINGCELLVYKLKRSWVLCTNFKQFLVFDFYQHQNQHWNKHSGSMYQ